jgi:hypothetical protein
MLFLLVFTSVDMSLSIIIIIIIIMVYCCYYIFEEVIIYMSSLILCVPQLLVMTSKFR